MELLPFQKTAVEQMLNFLKLRKCCYNASEMGTGKSIMAAESLNQLDAKRVLIICPAVMGRTWLRELKVWSKLPGIVFAIIEKSSDIELLNSCDYAIISYQLAAKNAEFIGTFKWDVLILDESHYCVQENTLISTPLGDVPIQNLSVGDEVYTICNNEVIITTIKQVISGNTSNQVTIRLNNGQLLNCLDWHQVRLSDGTWKRAQELQISDYVSVVQKSVGCQISFMGKITQVLLQFLCKVRPLPQSRLGYSYAEKESHEKSISSIKDETETKGNRPQACSARREWEGNSSCSKKNGVNFKNSFPYRVNFVGASRIYRKKKKKLSDLLQNRLCYSSFIFRGGSGWMQSSDFPSKKARYQKRQTLKAVRVEDIKIHKPGSSEYSSKSYYDLTLSEHFNYIANGIVVHNCKSHKTKRSKAIFKHIWPKATYKIALSGTPFTQCVTDCHTLFSRMAPDIFGEPDTQGWYAFANKFANQTRTPFGTTYHGLRNPVLLRKLIRENFFIRYTKEEVLPELPPKIWTEITLPPSYNVKGVYSKDPEVRKEIAKAIKAVNDGLPLPPPTHTAHYREQQGLLKIPAVIEFAENLLEENVPIILFAYHTSVIEKYTEALKKYNPAVITGATSAKARNKAVEDFQAGNTILFIGQLVAGGVGITLTTGSNLILAELDWSPANVSQACDRAHRIGQKVPVNIYYFVAEGSIDKDLQKAIIQKAKDFKEVMN